MGTIMMWAEVSEDAPHFAGAGTLYCKRADVHFAPAEGSSMHILPVPPGFEGELFRVKHVFWDPTGMLHVELVTSVVNPPIRGFMDYTKTRPWHTEIGGDLHTRFRRDGWVKA